MNVRIIMFHQDDPAKCTAAKMIRLGLARQVRRAGRGGLLLDPFSERMLLRSDAGKAGQVVGVDCSWRLAGSEFCRSFGGIPRRLPPLLAGNPVNYSKTGMLTTAEALSAALIIMGWRRQAEDILGRFGWGHTFLELNSGLLREYPLAKSQDDARRIARSYL